MPLFDRIREWADTRPGKPAIVQHDTSTTYGEFAQTIAAHRYLLAHQSLPPDRPIIVAIAGLRRAWCVVIALQSLGYDTAWAGSAAAAAEVGLLDQGTVVITHADEARPRTDERSWPSARIVALPTETATPLRRMGTVASHAPEGGHILYTSGTTGAHKKLRWSGASNPARYQAMKAARGYDEGTILHAGGFGLWTAAGAVQPPSVWTAGGCVIFDQRRERFRQFFHRPITHATVTSEDLKQILAGRDATDSPIAGLSISCVAGFLPLSLAEPTLRIAESLTVTYGSTECLLMMQQRFRTAEDLLWLTPYAGRQVEIVGPDGRPRANGEEGELRIGLTSIDCQEYVDDAAASGRIFRDGYYYPGDLAVRRADGRVRILGRSADVLNVRGQKLAVAEIEEAVRAQLGVEGVCMFSQMNGDGSEILGVAVEAPRRPRADDIAELKRRFGNEFDGVTVRVFERFPRETSGMRKVRRIALRQLMFGTGADDTPAA